MSQVSAGRRVAVALAAAAFVFSHGGAAAQEAAGQDETVASADAGPPDSSPLDLAPLDPSAPLDPMPGLGLEWPSLEEEEQGEIPTAPDTSIADSSAERSYSVHIEGLEELDTAELESRFAQLSTLEANRKEAANAAQIDRRAREDAELLAELLRANGYYDALVETRIEAPQGGGDIEVSLIAEPGPLYRFSEVRLPGLDAAGADAPALRAAFGIEQNDAVDAERVAEGTAALTLELGQRGYAFADIGDMQIIVDHESRTASLVLPVTPEGVRRFGTVTLEGRRLFSAGHVQDIARFQPGEPYRAAMVDDLRRALIATGLVSVAEVRPVERPGTDIVDLAVRLEPAPMRTIAGEAGYGTGEGVRVEGSWQHRNLIRPEGAVTVRGVLGTREQLVGVSLRQNNFRERDQVLTAQVVGSHLDQKAFEAHSFQIGAGLERQSNIIWQKKWTWSVGAELIASDERDVDLDTGTTRQRTFLIAAIPATLQYDGSNDLLDPTRGFRLAGRVSPELSLQNGAFGYTRAQVDATFYRPVSDRVVIAGRARLGTIFGASRDRIAPSRRFYAGGGGSVRGFGYQDLGPRDPLFDDPIGGRSLAEFAIEARVRVGNFGIVPFLDAGNIYTSPLPHLDNLRFGTGIGVRYHTSFGPIRLDVGTPINRRPGEPRIAVYVSLGQAF